MLEKAKAYRYKYLKEAITREFYWGCNADALWAKALGLYYAIKYYDDDSELAQKKIDCMIGSLPDIDVTPDDTLTPDGCLLDVVVTGDEDTVTDACESFSVEIR
jgi:hypothetical protein